jgi:DNA helicase-4
LRDRPYLGFKAAELELVLSEKGLTPSKLEDLLRELEFRRSTPKNDKIAKDAKARLAAMRRVVKSAPSALRDHGSFVKEIEAETHSEPLDSREDALHGGAEGSGSTDREGELNEIVLSAGVLPRLFGVSDISLSVVSNHLTIRSGDIVVELEAQQRINTVLESGLFFSRLTISSESRDCLIRGTQKQLAMLLAALEEFKGSSQVTYHIAELNRHLASHKYLNLKLIETWKEKAVSLGVNNPSPVLPVAKRLVKRFAEIKLLRDAHNQKFIRWEKVRYEKFFNTLEKTPLTDKQIEAILCDEDATLVNAGAGTGKTSTVVGKIAYLIKSGEALPDEILALAYGRDAAAELRERVKDRLGVDVEVRTFHSLGMQLLKDLAGHKLQIADAAKDERAFLALIARLLYEISKSDEGKRLVLEFVSFHRYPARFLDEYDSKHNYLQYMQKYEPRTLRGELVKSFEELLIADWLYLNGVKYEYEYPYAHETATLVRRQYKPDFYLSEYDIYLEHFGVDRDGQTAFGIDPKKYQEGIVWKRELHNKFGTTLIETYSWQRKEGVLLKVLKEACLEKGVQLKPFDSEQLRELLATRELGKKVVALLKDFLAVFKENQHSLEDLRSQIASRSAGEMERASCFFDLFELLYNRYQGHLAERQEIDFSDLIKLSTEALKRGEVKCEFKRIIIDEYQDISNGRYKLVQEILAQRLDSRIMCVGDDWQSIYGFTGSDVEKSTKFSEYFHFSTIVPLDQTFRFTEPIIALSSDFIQRNPNQLRKAVHGRDSSLRSACELFSFPTSADIDLVSVLRSVDSERPARQVWRVFLVARYNFCEPANLSDLKARFPMLKLEFLTVHASKGREADAVVILDIKGGRYGFPGSIENDPLMAYVIPGAEDIEYAEERRVMYVAMTRARDKVCFVCVRDQPSEFLQEISRHRVVHLAGGAKDQEFTEFSCPECRSGRLFLKFPNRSEGYGWRCEFSPNCDGKAKICPLCKSAPISASGACLSQSCNRQLESVSIGRSLKSRVKERTNRKR